MLAESVSSHPLAGQAQACGRLTQVDGPEGPTAPVVTTGSTQKKLDYISIILAPVHAILLCIKKKSPNCTCHPLRSAAVHGVFFAGQDGDRLSTANERQYSSSRAPVTDKQNATSSRVSSLQMTPTHSHSSRSSSSRSSCNEICS